MEKENPEIIKAPFTKEQTINLNTYQFAGYMHPFTCCSPDNIPECERRAKKSDGMLLVEEDGYWKCPCGKYKQDWAHSFMAEAKPGTITRVNNSDFYKFITHGPEHGQKNKNEDL